MDNSAGGSNCRLVVLSRFVRPKNPFDREFSGGSRSVVGFVRKYAKTRLQNRLYGLKNNGKSNRESRGLGNGSIFCCCCFVIKLVRGMTVKIPKTI